MKTHVEVSSSRRKSRKAHFSAPSHIKYRLMAARLSKELRTKHKITVAALFVSGREGVKHLNTDRDTV